MGELGKERGGKMDRVRKGKERIRKGGREEGRQEWRVRSVSLPLVLSGLC